MISFVDHLNNPEIGLFVSADSIPGDIGVKDLQHVISSAVEVLLGDGLGKYNRAWRIRPDEVDLAALLRHIGEPDQVDEDSGLLHAHHVVARAILIALRASLKAGELADEG